VNPRLLKSDQDGIESFIGYVGWLEKPQRVKIRPRWD